MSGTHKKQQPMLELCCSYLVFVQVYYTTNTTHNLSTTHSKGIPNTMRGLHVPDYMRKLMGEYCNCRGWETHYNDYDKIRDIGSLHCSPLIVIKDMIEEHNILKQNVIFCHNSSYCSLHLLKLLSFSCKLLLTS